MEAAVLWGDCVMTNEQQKAIAKDWPVVNLRGAVLDALDAHKDSAPFDAEFIDDCRDVLTSIYEDLTKEKVA